MTLTLQCPEDPEEKSVLVVVLVGGSSENELGLVKSYIQESGVSRNDITAKPLSKKNAGGRNYALDWI